MSENDPRDCGFLRTDTSGNYQFSTVRPASYPKKYNGRFIPQHIHFTIKANGFNEKRIQMVFEDDPAMSSSYWKDWAKNADFPVVKMIYSESKPYGICNIILTK